MKIWCYTRTTFCLRCPLPIKLKHLCTPFFTTLKKLLLLKLHKKPLSTRQGAKTVIKDKKEQGKIITLKSQEVTNILLRWRFIQISSSYWVNKVGRKDAGIKGKLMMTWIWNTAIAHTDWDSQPLWAARIRQRGLHSGTCQLKLRMK